MWRRLPIARTIEATKTSNIPMASNLIRNPKIIEDILCLTSLNDNLLKKELGFVPIIQKSSIPNAGNGLFVKGTAKQGQILSIYPGTIYMPWESFWLASINNHYILNCFDEIKIDAKPTGLSSLLFASHCNRVKFIQPINSDWMINSVAAMGHMINDSKLGEANARYQEIWLPPMFQGRLFNVHADMNWDPRFDETRTVCIIALRDITNEEIFVRYHEMIV